MQAFVWQDALIGVADFVDVHLNKKSPPLLRGPTSDQPGVAGSYVLI